jgi:hypothetical protein
MRFAATGSACAGFAPLGISAGVMPQKREMQTLWVVLPLQYAIRHAIAGATAWFGAVLAPWELEILLLAL